MASVSILVLAKNGSADIGALLEAVYSQSELTPLEVIVVDSGSTDGTLEIAQCFPVRIEQIPAQSFHHARTRNFAAGLATGEILVFLSQDAIPTSDAWLVSLVRNFDDDRVGAVYGRQIPKANASMERRDTLDTLYGEHRVVKDPAAGNDLGYRFYHFSDVNAALRRSVWEATGFPEELEIFEDLGIAKRILDAGWKIIYEPEGCVFHSHLHSTLGLFKRYFDIGYTLKYLRIWNSPGVGSSMLKDARKILQKKLSRSAGAIPKASSGSMRQDVAKSVGLVLGLNQRYIPLMVKRYLSAHGIYRKTSVS